MAGRKTLYPDGAVQITINGPLNLREELAKVANERRLSVSQLVVRILEEWLEHEGVAA